MSDIYLNISAGDGPKECQWVVVRLAHAFAKEADASGLKATILWNGDTIQIAPSVLMKFSGLHVTQFINSRIGTIRWIGSSHFRPHHKRKNWFVGVSKIADIADLPDLRESDIRYQSMKASGPGGQHVNATESAVRATHIPSGHSVVAREERSQHANKRLCRMKLALLFDALKSEAQMANKHTVWKSNKSLERGNAVRVYKGRKFKLEC